MCLPVWILLVKSRGIIMNTLYLAHMLKTELQKESIKLWWSLHVLWWLNQDYRRVTGKKQLLPPLTWRIIQLQEPQRKQHRMRNGMGRCLILVNFECLGVKPMPAYLMLSGKKVKQKAEKLEFIGYGLQTKKYCLIDEDTLKVTIQRM